ncbi:serine/threonine protein phosphatase 1 [Lewinella aquimaris]|uniref:Serine/threonine protein phosphatase 1 n=1 Tax=Neolewinella aquimaris TaxID=1835722 RepID=A0A840E6E9_9BACT|nr:metallophosphoesterase family protein [Neolewinella aquimaris]MBB4079195.1 serine/threonine protein phosphatase 1 [Neolewinella aquimaris]
MPRYAISDIHGCAQTFGRLLERIQLQKTDELFLLGDYIDRGPDSDGVLRMIWKLVHEKYSVVCLRGNHEQMLLDALLSAKTPWDYRPRRRDREDVEQWMSALPYYYETPGYLLVHAGLNFGAPDPLADTEAMLWARHWEEEVDEAWLGDRILLYGHTPATMAAVADNVAHMQETKYACIDSGCAMNVPGMGYLTAVNLDTGEAVFEAR